MDGQYRIVSQPPVVVPARDLAATYGITEDLGELIHGELRSYRETLREDIRELLERFEYVDSARKVVGVGSVGTRAFIVLLRGRTEGDPLFLQIKEATNSVLEDELPKSAYANHGERVVQGQRRMQAASDIFLGWTVGLDPNRHFYWRQLRDMKGSAEVEAMIPVRHAGIRRHVRLDARAGPRSIGRPDRDLGVSRRQRRLRPVDRVLLRAICRPERKGLPRVHRRDPVRTAGGGRRSVSRLLDRR